MLEALSSRGVQGVLRLGGLWWCYQELADESLSVGELKKPRTSNRVKKS